mmetsp:Transcript_10051/g.22600  ORF Transcript_10051/g.22600 Transcript_10051/m.22600 type:complete len:588 (-) Transcript_10051:102-1865(-)
MPNPTINRVEEDEEEEDDEEEEEEDDEPTEEELREMSAAVFKELRPKGSKTVPVEAFLAWDSVQDELAEGNLLPSDVTKVMKLVDKKGSGQLTLDMFVQAMDQMEEIMEVRFLENAAAEDLEEEEVEVPVKKGKGKEAPAPKEAAPKQPKAVLKAVETTASGTGFGKSTEEISAAKKAKSAAKGDENGEEIESMTSDIYDDLRGKGKTLSVKSFKEWDELSDMIESGAMKRSSLEKALMKAGCLETGQMTLQQFSKVLDFVQATVDVSSLGGALEDLEAEGETGLQGLRSSKNSQVMNPDLDLDETDEEDEDMDMEDIDSEQSEEEGAREIYDELRGAAETLNVGQFLRWDDVQELLLSGALTKDDLAQAIENCVSEIDSGDESVLTFETFYDLVQVIDEYVNTDLLPDSDGEELLVEKRLVAGDDVDEVMGIIDDFEEGEGVTKISYKQADGELLKGDAAVTAMEAALEQMEEDDEQSTASEEEVLEMFEELAKGKSYITEKALRRWDELQELVQAELATQEIIDSYFRKLDIQGGRVDLPTFQRFVEMLDTVLVDGGGNLLGLDDIDRAIDVDGLDIDDDEEEDE